jgi:predicted transcriptional regulator
MPFIEVNQKVFNAVQLQASQSGETSNEIIQKLISEIKIPHKSDKKEQTIQTIKSNKNIQDHMIPFIIKYLQSRGGKAYKREVENEMYKIFKNEFDKPYYQQGVSHNVPRWQEDVAWSKDRARQIHGLIKNAKESGRGIWELTDKGKKFKND